MSWKVFLQFTARIFGSHDLLDRNVREKKAEEGILALNCFGPEVPYVTSTPNSVTASHLTSGEAEKSHVPMSPEQKKKIRKTGFGETYPPTNLSL